MKKYMKYFIVSIFAFVSLVSSVSATTIKETTINGDAYDTIEDGSIVIGVTKFDSDVVITGARATKAGSNDAIVYMKLNSSLEGYNAPVIYIYAGGAWFALDESNNASVVEDTTLINKLSNNDIYFVNNEEKKIDIDVSGMNIDETKLPKGVTYKDGKVYVPATTDTFSLVTKEGTTVKFIKDGTLFMKDQSECYTLSGNTITSYNSQMCGINVKIPSKVNDVNITAIGADAFKGKEIETVIIPGHIKSIGDNAFADNNLKSVTIEDKYDSSDFETYGNNVFGTFTDVKYKNDLTEFLAQFQDEIVLKVSEDFDLNNKYPLAPYAEYIEFKRLGLSRDDSGFVNGKYRIIYDFEYDTETQKINFNKMKISIRFDVNQSPTPEDDKIVEKYVQYNIKQVSAENENYKNIIEEYEKYFDSLENDFINNNYKLKIMGPDKFYNICDKYGYECYTYAGGDGGGNFTEGLSFQMEGKENLLIYDDILYDNYLVEFYSAIVYGLSLLDEYASDDLLVDAAILKFEEKTGMANYEINYTDNSKKYYGPYLSQYDGHKMYSVNLVDNDTENRWYLSIYQPGKRGSITELSQYTSNEIAYINNLYIPLKTLDEFEGKVSEYIDAVVNELKQKVGVDGFVNISVTPSATSSYNGENYVGTFSINIEDHNTTSTIITYKIYFDNNLDIPYEIMSYEVQSNLKDFDGTLEEYFEVGINELVNEKNLTDYFVQPNYSVVVKDPETGEFSYGNLNEVTDENKYYGKKIIDFAANREYTVYIPYRTSF